MQQVLFWLAILWPPTALVVALIVAAIIRIAERRRHDRRE